MSLGVIHNNRPRTLRSQPINTFQLSSRSSLITPEQWKAREPDAVWYGIPLEAEYTHPSGRTIVRCMAQATRGDGKVLGYLAMPRRYVAAWSQLCYNVVYWLTLWKAWLAEREKRKPRIKRQPKILIPLCIERASCYLIKYLHIRRLIIDELLENESPEDEEIQLDLFDEYIIRDRWDWLWTEYDDVPEIERHWLSLDPVHESNKDVFCKVPFLLFHAENVNPPSVAPPKQDSPISPEMIVPSPAPPHTWARGAINHFDFQKYFYGAFPCLIYWLRRKVNYNPYDPETAIVVVHWHEDHQPPVHFVAEEEANLPPEHRAM